MIFDHLKQILTEKMPKKSLQSKKKYNKIKRLILPDSTNLPIEVYSS